jgi:hypothetical protein
MTDGDLSEMHSAEQIRPLVEEARLARAQAEDAVDRIQQRIERLASRADNLVQARSDDSKGLRELAPSTRPTG